LCWQLKRGVQERTADFERAPDLGFVADRQCGPLQSGADLHEHVDEALELTRVRDEASVSERVLQALGEALMDEAVLGEQQPECDLRLTRDEPAHGVDLNGRGHHTPNEVEHAVDTVPFGVCASVGDERPSHALEHLFEELLARADPSEDRDPRYAELRCEPLNVDTFTRHERRARQLNCVLAGWAAKARRRLPGRRYSRL
jgi:hypothetical protein